MSFRGLYPLLCVDTSSLKLIGMWIISILLWTLGISQPVGVLHHECIPQYSARDSWGCFCSLFLFTSLSLGFWFLFPIQRNLGLCLSCPSFDWDLENASRGVITEPTRPVSLLSEITQSFTVCCPMSYSKCLIYLYQFLGVCSGRAIPSLYSFMGGSENHPDFFSKVVSRNCM